MSKAWGVKRGKNVFGPLILKRISGRKNVKRKLERSQKLKLLLLPKIQFKNIAPPALTENAPLVPVIPLAPAVVPVPEIQVVSREEESLTSSGFIRPGPKLKASLEGFLFDQRSEHTRRAYSKDIKRFVKFLLVREMSHGAEPFGRTLVIAYKDWLLSEKLEHTTVDRHLATLRSLFKWLVEDGVLKDNPAQNIRFLKPKRLSKTIGFSDVEVKKVLSKPNLHTRSGALHRAILMVLFYCGLRRSELCELRTSSLGEERGYKVIRLRGKGDKERIIPLKPEVWEAIEYYLKIARKDLKEDQPLFTPNRNNRSGETDKHLDSSMVYYIVTRYSREAGVANRVSPHSCRATAISNARDHNVADRAIQEFAGWASTDMITRYDKRKTAVEDSAAHAIDYSNSEKKKEQETESSSLSKVSFSDLVRGK